MKIIKEDDTLLKIKQLNEIRSIDFIDLYMNSSKDKTKIIPGFLVFYGRGEELFLTSRDKYFDQFVKKIHEVYNAEKDKVIDYGVLGNKKIEINALTREILLSGELENTSEYYSQYKKIEGYNNSLLFEEDYVESIFNIVEYHLKKSLERLNIYITDITLSKGNNGLYFIEAKKKDQKEIFPVVYQKENYDTLNFEIGNLFNKIVPLSLNIKFKEDGLFISSRIKEYNYTDTNSYIYKNDKVDYKRICYLNGDIVCIEDNEFNNPTKVLIPKIEEEENTEIMIPLPWNSYLKVEKNEESISDNPNKIIETKKMMYYTSNNNYYLKKKINKKYMEKSSENTLSDTITLDSINQEISGIHNNQGYIIESAFSSNGVGSFYKSYLSERYFYYVTEERNIERINKTNITPVGRVNGIEDKRDLLEIKKYIKSR